MDPTSSEINTMIHTIKPMSRTVFNRIFAVIYSIALLSLFYLQFTKLIIASTVSCSSFFISISMLTADLTLGFMWITSQAFRLRPVSRNVFLENIEKMKMDDFPGLDIFICTADPYKEPPINVVNTALSMMAYDYPMEKLSVYVSDDGGSQLTLFAFMEAAKFAAHWLPFCRENEVVDRWPRAFFGSTHYPNKYDDDEEIKEKYDEMKLRIENAVKSGHVGDYVNVQEHKSFSKWTDGFTRLDHPAVIQVLVESKKDKDASGKSMPNLIYVSREKMKTCPHHFKAGALNTLLRVSAIMSNAPIVLTQDCDMFSNDPTTPHRVLCYYMDDSIRRDLAYVQFPQRFHGVNKDDIYSSEMKRWFKMNPQGMDGVLGPDNMGSGCFFMRRAFFGGPSPSSFVAPEIPQLSPDHVVVGSSDLEDVMELANVVAGCNYECNTSWGSQIGFRYGSLVEDYFTGYRLHCMGWKSIFCDPERAAFFGDVPNSLFDVVNQHKRWCVGLLEVAFSKYSPLTFGMRNLGLLQTLCYAYYACSPLWSLPILIYSFLPQLTLLNHNFIFPKVSSGWFLLYVFLFVGSYAQDWLEFSLAQGTPARWWNEQRIWTIRGLTSYLFGGLEYISNTLGFATQGFNVTSKVVDDEQGRRYEQGVFDFGPTSSSPMLLPLATAALVNLVAIAGGAVSTLMGSSGDLDGALLQLFVCGFGVLNCLPVYEAMFLRSDGGRMPLKTTAISVFLAAAAHLMLN